MGVAVGDYNNDGFPDLYVTCVGQSRLFRQHRPGHVHRRHGQGGPGQPAGLQQLRALVRFRPRRAARPVRLQLREVVAGAGRLLHGGRQAEAILHAGGLPRRDLLAVSQPRQRHVRGRDGLERHLRQQLEIARRRHVRLRRGRLDRTSSSPTTRSRTSSTATCKNGTLSGRGRARRRGLQRRRQGARRHGRGHGRLRQLGASRAWW